MAVKHDAPTDTYTAVNNDTEEIECTVVTGHINSTTKTTTKTKIFPDSGATICLGGTKLLETVNISLLELIPTKKRIAVVGGSTLPCIGWAPVTFTVGRVQTEQ